MGQGGGSIIASFLAASMSLPTFKGTQLLLVSGKTEFLCYILCSCVALLPIMEYMPSLDISWERLAGTGFAPTGQPLVSGLQQ